jgi:hypothetical protein
MGSPRGWERMEGVAMGVASVGGGQRWRRIRFVYNEPEP